MGDDEDEMGDNLAVVDLGGKTATSIAAGCDFTCAIVEDGSVMCWWEDFLYPMFYTVFACCYSSFLPEYHILHR